MTSRSSFRGLRDGERTDPEYQIEGEALEGEVEMKCFNIGGLPRPIPSRFRHGLDDLLLVIEADATPSDASVHAPPASDPPSEPPVAVRGRDAGHVTRPSAERADRWCRRCPPLHFSNVLHGQADQRADVRSTTGECRGVRSATRLEGTTNAFMLRQSERRSCAIDCSGVGFLVGRARCSAAERLLEEMAMTELVGRGTASPKCRGQCPRFARSKLRCDGDRSCVPVRPPPWSIRRPPVHLS